jgi:hypothetical protein
MTLVGAFAVSRSAGHTGDGFLKLRRDILRLPIPADEDGTGKATWRVALDESVGYWQSDRADGEQHQLSDAQFNKIMAELGMIKQMLRQLLHG